MTQPFFIEPEGFYDTDSVATICDLSIRSINDACRNKELRHTKRAGRLFFRGSWLIEWLEGQETSNAGRAVEAPTATGAA